MNQTDSNNQNNNPETKFAEALKEGLKEGLKAHADTITNKSSLEKWLPITSLIISSIISVGTLVIGYTTLRISKTTTRLDQEIKTLERELNTAGIVKDLVGPLGTEDTPVQRDLAMLAITHVLQKDNLIDTRSRDYLLSYQVTKRLGNEIILQISQASKNLSETKGHIDSLEKTFEEILSPTSINQDINLQKIEEILKQIQESLQELENLENKDLNGFMEASEVVTNGYIRAVETLDKQLCINSYDDILDKCINSLEQHSEIKEAYGLINKNFSFSSLSLNSKKLNELFSILCVENSVININSGQCEENVSYQNELTKILNYLGIPNKNLNPSKVEDHLSYILTDKEKLVKLDKKIDLYNDFSGNSNNYKKNNYKDIDKARKFLNIDKKSFDDLDDNILKNIQLEVIDTMEFSSPRSDEDIRFVNFTFLDNQSLLNDLKNSDNDIKSLLQELQNERNALRNEAIKVDKYARLIMERTSENQKIVYVTINSNSNSIFEKNLNQSNENPNSTGSINNLFKIIKRTINKNPEMFVPDQYFRNIKVLTKEDDLILCKNQVRYFYDSARNDAEYISEKLNKAMKKKGINKTFEVKNLKPWRRYIGLEINEFDIEVWITTNDFCI